MKKSNAMLQKGVVLSAIAATGAGCATVKSTEVELPKKPNILFIMTDDQGAWTPSYTGFKGAVTPNLDILRQQGMEFTNAFCNTPVCSPSRASLMTGRYAIETSITDYIHDKKTGLNPKFTCWPELLQKAGYKTGLIGKWHLGHAKQEHHPTVHGYDYFMGLKQGGCYGKDAKLEKDGTEKKFPGLLVDVLTDDALTFIESSKDQPFALSLHYRAPHAAYLPVSDEVWREHEKSDHYVPSYPGMDQKKVSRKMREYCAAVTGIDVNLGRIMKKLDELGIADNTVVVFTSDHGYNLGHHGVWAKGNGVWMVKQKKKWPNIPAFWRPNLWDTSLKVPFVVRWPKAVKPGSKRTETVDFTDIFPTFCKLAGAEVPEGTVLRGEDFSPLLSKSDPKWDNELYCEYDQHTGGAKVYMRGWRTENWKLMVDFNNPGRGDLFDLKNDPDELTNLFTKKDSKLKAVKKELLDKILKRMKDTGDPILEKIGPWMEKVGM